MKRNILSLLMLMVATAVVCGNPSPQRGSAMTNAPAKIRDRQNPFVDSDSARLAGKKLFQRYCATCHGETAEGSEQAPSLLRVSGAETPGTLQWFIRNGDLRRGMPAWSRLTDQQVWQIVTYLKRLSI